MARVVAVAMGHHITRRGNYRQTVFFEDNDGQLYLTYCRKTPRATPSACLGSVGMSNDVHMIVVREREDSLACALGRTHAYTPVGSNTVEGGHVRRGAEPGPLPMDTVNEEIRAVTWMKSW